MIDLALLVFQFVSTFWSWYENTEQIRLFEQALRNSHNSDRHIMHKIHEAIASLIVLSTLMANLTLLTCYQTVRCITRPLADLQKELETRAADSLVPTEIHSLTTEIQTVVPALSDPVTRLASTIENERLFTADAVHELRTLPSGVRLHLELLSKTHKADITPLTTHSDQMVDSASQLLQLAHVGQSSPARSYQHVKLLEDVILPSYDELGTILDQRKRTLLLSQGAADVVVRGDVMLLQVLLRSLMENAHRYDPEGTHITTSLSIEHDAVLTVEGEGPGIDESEYGELSKTFVRTDSHFDEIGLGLSIINRITWLHHRHSYLRNRQGASNTRAWVELTRDQ